MGGNVCYSYLIFDGRFGKLCPGISRNRFQIRAQWVIFFQNPSRKTWCPETGNEKSYFRHLAHGLNICLHTHRGQHDRTPRCMRKQLSYLRSSYRVAGDISLCLWRAVISVKQRCHCVSKTARRLSALLSAAMQCWANNLASSMNMLLQTGPFSHCERNTE